jgi:hypothetical protein
VTSHFGRETSRSETGIVAFLARFSLFFIFFMEVAGIEPACHAWGHREEHCSLGVGMIQRTLAIGSS